VEVFNVVVLSKLEVLLSTLSFSLRKSVHYLPHFSNNFQKSPNVHSTSFLKRFHIFFPENPEITFAATNKQQRFLFISS